MSDEDFVVRVGTPEEARGDYDHDQMKQQEVDAMKTYRVVLKYEAFYGFDVRAHDEEEARQLAVNRSESGDWGREEYGSVDIYEVEESK